MTDRESVARFIPVAEPDIGEREIQYVTDAVRSGWVSSRGDYIRKFEEAFAAYCGVRYAITTSSGTTALHLALLALGIGPGDEVIVPTFTFVATASAVTYTGARPVFVDSDPLTWCINPQQIEAKITPRTKAIIPVHIYGHPADMDPIVNLAQKYGLKVIEDAAEAHGAEYKGQKVGGIGDVGVFSFYGNKIITTGEGGCLVTNDPGLAERAKLLKNHGMDPQKAYWHPVIGYNYRLTNLQAALGLAQLEQIEGFIWRKRQVARWYRECLEGYDDLTMNPEASWAKSVFWMNCILVRKLRSWEERDRFMSNLGQYGINTRPAFYPIHALPPYACGNMNEDFPIANTLSAQGICLPSSAILSQDDVKYICDRLKDVLADWSLE